MQHSFQSTDFYFMPKAFISYARDGGYGEKLAADIQQQLLAAGFVVFRDVIGLKPGDVWFHKLDSELESSNVMVLVLSKKVRTSVWVPSEVDMAKELGIPVVPVLAEKMVRPIWVRHLQILDFTQGFYPQVLIDAIHLKLGAKDEAHCMAEKLARIFVKLSPDKQASILDYVSFQIRTEKY